MLQQQNPLDSVPSTFFSVLTCLLIIFSTKKTLHNINERLILIHISKIRSIRYKVAGVEATFNEIQKMLSQHNGSDIDCETWERIALADFELNYKPWSLNSLRFWA